MPTHPTSPLLVLLLALLVAGLMPACGDTSVGDTDGSGIEGRVLAGPACPVVVEGSPCLPNPLASEVRVTDASGDVVASVRSNADGRFRIELPAAEYLVEAVPEEGTVGTSEQLRVQVREGEFTRVTLHVDTGIR